MKSLREITRMARTPRLTETTNPINADCRLLQIHNDMTDDEKWDLIEQFARRGISIKNYDVFLMAVW
jgi:hypothetical protein